MSASIPPTVPLAREICSKCLSLYISTTLIIIGNVQVVVVDVYGSTDAARSAGSVLPERRPVCQGTIQSIQLGGVYEFAFVLFV